MQQSTLPREASPSPSFRELQRTHKSHSMPIVPSVNQILASAPQNQQPSPTTSNSSHQSRRTPPPTSRISPTAGKVVSGGTNGRDRSPQRLSSPPPLLHAHSQPVVTRPIPRVPPPQFLTNYQTTDDKWQMTPELVADIERADQLKGQMAGTSGLAYAGGAASSHLHHAVSVRDPAVERIRASDRASPKERIRDKERDRDGSNSRESPKTRERSQTQSSITSPLVDPQGRGQERPSDFRGSPQYQSPMASPNERTAQYTQYIPDAYPSQQSPTGPVTRKPPPSNSVDVGSPRDTPPNPNKLSNQTPPSHSRPPDRALPLQEEPEEDVGHEHLENNKHDYLGSRHTSPTPSPDIYAENGRYDDHDEDDASVTLNDEADDHDQHSQSEDESSGFTPRSPSTTLPERPPYANHNQYPSNGDNQRTIRAKPRAGTTDQLGMRGFDAALFENSTVNSLRNGQDVQQNGSRQAQPSRSPPQTQAQTQPPQYRQNHQEDIQQQQQYAASRSAANHFAEQYMHYGSSSLPSHLPSLDELHSSLDDPTSAYLQSFLQSPKMRPGAPIPPTPHSRTSPSPAISATPSVMEHRQVGSPYPFPFGHIRRTAIPAAQAPSSSFVDPNLNPSMVREQLALQMQIYALNNGLGSPSDSAFSPASTPYPGPGYNPWAFVHQGARPGDSAMSMRSSPSHEPLPLPLPPLRGGRPARRKESSALRNQVNAPRRRVKPPPRVESTQPRDTSPEPSSGSGEETAGEDLLMSQYIQEDLKWSKDALAAEVEVEVGVGEEEEDGDWVDENEDEEEDLLQLEYHPTFIQRTDKRRRRWETRWDALAQAVSFRLSSL